MSRFEKEVEKAWNTDYCECSTTTRYRFKCRCCDISFDMFSKFKQHTKTKKHQNNVAICDKRREEYTEECLRERMREECERRGITEEEYEILYEEYI